MAHLVLFFLLWQSSNFFSRLPSKEKFIKKKQTKSSVINVPDDNGPCCLCLCQCVMAGCQMLIYHHACLSSGGYSYFTSKIKPFILKQWHISIPIFHSLFPIFLFWQLDMMLVVSNDVDNNEVLLWRCLPRTDGK